MTSSCLCKNSEGAGFPFQVEALEDGVNDTIHALDVHKANHGRVRRRTSTEQRLMMLVVRSFFHEKAAQKKFD